MKLYLIGSLRNPEVTNIARQIRDRFSSVEVFDDWMAAGPKADDHWKDYEIEKGHSYKQALKGYAAKHVFEFDRFHLDTADAAVLILPAGRSGGIELGYMVGRSKDTFILLDTPERYDVMFQFADHIAENTEELLEQINETLILGRGRSAQHNSFESFGQHQQRVLTPTGTNSQVHKRTSNPVFELAEVSSSEGKVDPSSRVQVDAVVRRNSVFAHW